MKPKKGTETTRHPDGRLEVVTLKRKFLKVSPDEPTEEELNPPVRVTGHNVVKIINGKPKQVFEPVPEIIELEDEPELTFAQRHGLPVLRNGNTIPDEFKVFHNDRETSLQPVKLKGRFQMLFARNPLLLQADITPERQEQRDTATAEYLRLYPRKQWPPPALNDATPLPNIGLCHWLSEKAENEIGAMLKEMRSLSTRCMQEINEIVRNGKYHCAPPQEIRRRLILCLVMELREVLDPIPE